MKKVVTLLAAAFVLLPAMTFAQTKPLWLQRGVKPLNEMRTNGSYEFRILNVSQSDITMLEVDRLVLLEDHIAAKYRVNPLDIVVDSLRSGDNGRTTYRLSFAVNGRQTDVMAQLVDEYSKYRDNVDTFDYELSLLFAISAIGSVPSFDSFELTRRYPAKAALMSVVPGLGQIYKGQAGKGYAIIGTEAVLAGGAVFTAIEARRYGRLVSDNPGVAESYDNKASAYRMMRNGCLAAAGGVYIYNLVDAAFANGARRVVVGRPDGSAAEFAFAPVVTEYGGLGLGMTVKF